MPPPGETTGPAILAEGIVKQYGQTRALDQLSLTVPAGSVHGLLGPNGAGKTTAVRILTTLLRPDAGHARVAGLDVTRHGDEVRQRISVTGQNAAIDEILSGRQNLVLFGRLRRLSPALARRRADELLERFGLAGDADKSAGQYSGGMRRRLDLAASLIVPPEVLFLDEPTTGLDPRSRNDIWDAVRALAAAGTTVLLTTQYLEEADQLADHIWVIDSGRTVAGGTPNELKAKVGGSRIEVVVADAAQLPGAESAVTEALAAPVHVDPTSLVLSASVTDRMASLGVTVSALLRASVVAEDVRVRQPTLDEVFLQLTGHTSQDQTERAPAEVTR